MIEPNARTDCKADRWRLVLISLSIVMGFQVVRVFLTTLVYAFGERYGQTLAAGPALVVFVSPFLAPLVFGRFSPRKLLVLTWGGLAIARLLMQISRDVNMNMVLAGVAIVLALMGLVVVFSFLNSVTIRQRRQFAQALILGMALEAGLHGAFQTWDYVWQPGLIPFVTTLVVSVLALFALWRVQSSFPDRAAREPGFRDLLPIAALGPCLMLEMLFFQNVAFIASSALTSMELGLTVVLIGNAVGLWVVSIFPQQSLLARLAAGAMLVAIAALLPRLTGGIVIAMVVIGQGLAAGLLSAILSRRAYENTRPSIVRVSVVTGSGSLMFILLIILYYISTLVTLPFSYTILPPIAALVILLAAFAPVMETPDNASSWRLAGLPLGLLVIPVILFATRPASEQSSSDAGRFRLVSYNIHQTISFDGWLDPEGIALVVEAQKPDLIVFQEVSRGWLIAGSLDVAEWLSRRLQMPYVYAPGHDYQFGNIIFTRLPIKSWSFARLPLHNVPLGRGLIQAEIDLGNGQSITVINPVKRHQSS